MALLDYTDIQTGVFFKLNGIVYETLESTYSKKSRQKGANQIRIKNLVTGAVVSKALRASDKPEEVLIEKAAYVFVYVRGDEVVVHPEGSPSERVTLPFGSLHNINLIPSGTKVTALMIDGDIAALQLPLKIDLAVKEAPPSIRGNTTQGGTKKVVVETGASVTTPLFIEVGDCIRVHITTGEYTERVSKK